MTVLLISGSPTNPSRSSYLLNQVERCLENCELSSERIVVRQLPAQALLHADANDPELRKAIAQVESASAIVISTPIYKAAYSGALKLFLDLLPQTAFSGKTILPLATGGSPNHMLAIDYALRPVLQALYARHVLPGVYATDAQVVRVGNTYSLDSELRDRLEEATGALVAALPPVEISHFGELSEH